VLLGALFQLLIQTPDLRGVKLRFRIDLANPDLRRILRLYLPIALGLVVSNVQVAIDQRLASSTGENSIAWMDQATTMVQFPHGMVAVAISLAVLPTLSRLSAAGDHAGFRHTLGQGLRLVLVLIVPVTLGLWVLARPAIALLFQHGAWTAYDTYWTAQALHLYLLGLVFASIDWPLNYAFYARQDTLTPALVGIVSVGAYLAVALPLHRTWGMLGLVLADSVKHFCHALLMLYLTWRRIGQLGDMQLGQTVAKVLLASGVMTGVMFLGSAGVSSWLGTEGWVANLGLVAIPGGLGVAVYLGLVSVMRVEEIRLLGDQVRRRLGRA
jgi:putative peptidoglycan lipid II flippase